MRIKELWQVAALVTGFTLISLSTAQTKLPNQDDELPSPTEPTKEFRTHPDYEGQYSECYLKRWMNDPSFMMWLMRIQYTDHNVFSFRWDMGTGSLISRRHVLTSCYPTVYVEQAPEHGLHHVVIVPAFIHYAGVKPDGEKGIFPWALRKDLSETRDCDVDVHFTVHSTIAPRGCNINFAANDSKPFLLNATATNMFLILALKEEIPLKSANSQYMPFDFDVDGNLGLVRWYQSFRKARCVIPRWVASKPGLRSDKNIQYIEQYGFTYRSLPFEQKCVVELCSKYCNGSEDAQNCYGNCTTEIGQKYHGRLLCLKKMNENIKDNEKYSTVLDVDDVHTPNNTKELCRVKIDKGFYMWVVNGAPVVCNGAVIAIVTQCFEDFLVAATLTPIHHQLFKWGPVY